METEEKVQKRLQWHPAFYAGLQIELQEDSDNLIFENEHQLGTKPKQIDALIIKKQKDISIKKNIGKIFRGHNIVEYKSPTDYLCIDDYYKGYASLDELVGNMITSQEGMYNIETTASE